MLTLLLRVLSPLRYAVRAAVVTVYTLICRTGCIAFWGCILPAANVVKVMIDGSHGDGDSL